MLETYKFIIRYYNKKWRTFTDIYYGYHLSEAIERCKEYDYAFEFKYQKAYIVAIYKDEGNGYWSTVSH